jgi:UDP-N-acetylmuramoyl-L-alanyl-D-glutamate--2,6-diaminopimelate ligase
MMVAPTPRFALADLVSPYVDLDTAARTALAEITPTDMCMDSRQVKPGDLFLACGGRRAHGQTFIEQAVSAGAVAVLWECGDNTPCVPLNWRSSPKGRRVPLIAVPQLSSRVGVLADQFYGHPSADLFVVGVTGTNGKTSCSQFLAQTLQADQPCGVMGTLGHGIPPQLVQTGHTTPDAVTCHRWLAEMRDAGVSCVSMEVSSHALDQGRVDGVRFDCAVFTNLTREHLDYHGDMAAYQQAKSSLFHMPGLRYAVINSDDPFGRRLLSLIPDSVEIVTYGLDCNTLRPTVCGQALQLTDHGMHLTVNSAWGSANLDAPLFGRFNASNLLAVFGVLLLHGVPLPEVVSRLARVKPVAGRLERFEKKNKPRVFVDYAHTPDALEQVLGTLADHTRGKLWCVFGCGGERDRGKRPLMGEIAERLADFVVLTDDNPRHEDPLNIIEDIQRGMHDVDAIYVQRDRREAIRLAITNAQAEDIILVAGKGHEDYQLIGDETRFFSDADEVRALLES